MVTLEDIARKAGVSHSTVSRALAGSTLVNADTKERIRQLAEECGYQVNQVARNLKAKSTQTIGLVVPEVSNPYYPKLIQQIADLASESGYSLQLHLSGSNQGSEAACLNSLRSNRADGILIITAERGLVARPQVDALVAYGTPVVVMGWVENADHLDIVTGDDAEGGYELGRHLVELGHRSIALLGKPPHRGEFDRNVGFCRALAESGISIAAEYLISALNDDEVRDGVKQLLALNPRPTAVFAYQDSLAALVYKHLADAGVQVPTDISVVGFDNLDLATYLNPALTTVGNHIGPLATALFSRLVDRIRDTARELRPTQIVITPHLVVRSSSGPPRNLGTKEFKS